MNIFRVSFLALLFVSVRAQGTTSDPSLVSCDLQCANDGYCTLVEGTTEDLARQAQSGILIEKCVCKPGFTGLTCNTEVEECSLPERRCNNKARCRQDNEGEWGCDCSEADALSFFAGHQCRNPTTEYCTGKYDPYAALSFCTNGGRCLSDFLAAQVAPGDTAFNSAYAHRGCKCPDEFYGPHCEFLKFQGTVEEEKESDDIELATASSFMKTILTLMVLSVMMLGALIVYKIKARPVPREISIQPTSFRRGYDESRYNGRHRSYSSQNLHAQSVFQDAVVA